MASNLVRRVAFAAVAIPLALGLVYLGGWPLTLLVSLISLLGARELLDFAHRQGITPPAALVLGTAALLPAVVYGSLSGLPAAQAVADNWPYWGAGWVILLLSWVLAVRAPTEKPLSAVAVALLALLYTGALPAFLLLIRHGQYGLKSWPGTWLVFFPLVVTWVCDTAAMFGGQLIGGPKLAPTVSPGKTRSGSAAGVVGGLLVAVIFCEWVFPRVGLSFEMWHLLAVAGVLSIIGQVGDLAESLFKREVGLKDSSHLIPGHGGVLDRFDSLYFVIPAAAAMFHCLGAV